MQYGARNRIDATVTSIRSGEVMSLVKFDVPGPIEMSSVLTTESAEAMGLKPGDQGHQVVKATHVLPVKE